MKNGILLTALLATISWPVSADSLYLRDGRVLQGTFMGGSNSEVRFLPRNGSTQRYPISSVDNVIFGNGPVNNSSNNSYPNNNRDANGSYRDDGYRARTSSSNQIPAGTVITVRMIDSIDSDVNNAGQTFRASLDDPLVVNGRTIADRGAEALVKVVRVQQSGRISGQEEIGCAVRQFTLMVEPTR